MKSLKITLLFISTVLLLSCSSATKNPEKAAEKYLEYCIKGDVDGAAKFLLELNQSAKFSGDEFETALEEISKNMSESDISSMKEVSQEAYKKIEELYTGNTIEHDEDSEE